MILLIMGPQGSGKSTQGKLLAKKYGLTFVSTGEVLRELYKSGVDVGLEAEQYWGCGELVPDHIVAEVMSSFFKRNRNDKGYVIDGYPRSESQLGLLDKVLPEPITALILLHLGGRVIEERLKKRWHLEHRPDEQPAAIKRRLEIYEQLTEPLIDEFRKMGIKILEVDASPSIDDVFKEIDSKLLKEGIVNE